MTTPQPMAEETGFDLDVSSALSHGSRARQEDALVTAFSGGTDVGFAILSDGMGGHAAGDLASRIIVTEIFAELTLRSSDPEFAHSDIPAQLQEAVAVANECLRAHIDAAPTTSGMGGTVIATVVADNRLYWISIGDSPLYLYRGGRLIRINDDHSMAPQIDLMARQGVIDEETARNHPQRNCLTSALLGEDIAEIDCPDDPLTLKPDDLVIVASDGLQFLEDEAIAEILDHAADEDSRDIAAALMGGVAALADPDQDNTSLVVIKARPVFEPQAELAPVTSQSNIFQAWTRKLSPLRQITTRG